MLKEVTNKLPKHWKWVRIADVSSINPKLPNKNQIHNELEVQFLPMKLVEETINKIHLTQTRNYSDVIKGSYTPFVNGDVIFAKVTPCMENGKIALANNLKNGIGFGSSEFHVIRAGEQILGRYIFNYLVQDKFRSEAAKEMTGAVGLRRVPKQFVENYFIPLPPLKDQRAIVSKIEELFSKLDKGIESLKTAQQQLKTYRQVVLKWAFEGKLTNKNVKEGELPKGWKIVELKDVTEKITDGEHFRPKTQESGIPFLSAKDVRDEGVSFDGPLYISKETAEKAMQRCNPQKGDLLIVSRGATVGRMCIVNTDKQFCLLGSVILIKVNKMINSKILNYILKSPLANQKIIGVSGATAQQAIYLRDIKNISIPLPPPEEQERLIGELENSLSAADKLEESISQSLQQAEALRQSILKMAFEGRLIN